MGYCTWAGMNEANRIYHDTEWGIPVGRQSCIRGMMQERFRSVTGSPTESVKI